MELQELLKQIADAARFKNDQNLMERHVKICINDEDCVDIECFAVDYKGDIIIHIHVEHEVDLEEE